MIPDIMGVAETAAAAALVHNAMQSVSARNLRLVVIDGRLDCAQSHNYVLN